MCKAPTAAGQLNFCFETQLIILCDFVAKKNLTHQNKLDTEFEFNRLSTLLQLCQLCNDLTCASVVGKDDLKYFNDSAVHLNSVGAKSTEKITTASASKICSKLGEIWNWYYH